MPVSLSASYLILIVVTCPALIRLRLVSIYRTFYPNDACLAFTLLCYCLASLPLSSFSMILFPVLILRGVFIGR